MTGYVRSLNRSLKRYDRRLRAVYVGEGMVHILFLDANMNKMVMAVTDNWAVSGKPVMWGWLPILERLQYIDASSRTDFFDEIRKNRERNGESSKRAFSNEIESRLKYQRRSFAKAFDGINTSTLDKTKDKRRLKDGN